MICRAYSPAFFTLLVIALPFSLRAQGTLVPLSSTHNELILLYRPGVAHTERLSNEGRLYTYFPQVEMQSGFEPGQVSLPSESFMIALPSTGTARVSILEQQVEEMRDIRIAPNPALVITEDPEQPFKKVFDWSIPPRLTEEKQRLVTLGSPQWWRYQRVASVEFRPYEYDPERKVLRRYTFIKIRITFDDVQTYGSAIHDESFESIYRSAIVNYDQSRTWRSMPQFSAESAVRQDSTALWFNPSAEYVRIALADDGIYKLTYERLAALNCLPSNPDPRNADLWYKGKSILFRISGSSDGSFDPGDYLEFYGSRLYDSVNTTNEFSDTSIYWLTFSGNGLKRPAVDSVVAASPDVVVAYFEAAYRMEKDSFYFFGNGGLPANNQSDKVPGEGWYWKKLLANQTAAMSFVSQNFYKTGNPNYLIKGRLHSPVRNSPQGTHSIDLLVNGTMIGNIQFLDSRDTVFSLTASSTLFVEGSNSIAVRSNPTSASINEVFVDWIEVVALKTLRAVNDTLLITSPQGNAGQVALFQVEGFSTSGISAYRIDESSGIDKVFVGTLTGSSAPFSLSFTDTLRSGKQYLLVAESKKRLPERLSRKSFANLRNQTSGADYLVITAMELMTEAGRLATYRGQKGIGRVKVVSVEDIYDEFNFGMFDPFALRRFLLAVDTLWNPPKPATVVLFGDANWDYKNRLQTGRRNLVPSLGNPVSDAWLVSAVNDPFLPEKKVGRIPAASAPQAASFVDMIIRYEADPLSPWNKRFLFMAYGFDSVETLRFSGFSETLISQSIIPSPVAGQPVRMYKTSPVVDFEQTEEVKRILNDGAVWINFYGHAGTDFWGNGLTRADQLINKEGKRHLVTDISCSTVRFAEPAIESFAEKLLFASDGGAVAYMGSSGFGYESPLRTIATRLFNQMSADTVREVGTLLLGAKVYLRGLGAPGIISQQALQQMTLLGDPATVLAVGKRPDFAVSTNTVSVDPPQPSEADREVNIRIPIANVGLLANDSLDVRITHFHEETVSVLPVLKRKAFALADTISISEPTFIRGGSHTLQITIDAENRIEEASEANNFAEVTFFVTSGQLQTLAPFSSAAVHPDSVRLVIHNPNIPATATWKAMFEIDTSESFTNPIRYTDVSLGTVTTQRNVLPAVLQNNKLYYWRARLVDRGDSTGWSSSFFITRNTLNTRWLQDRAPLFTRNSLNQLAVANQVRLQSKVIPLEVYSAGFEVPGGAEAIVRVDGVNVSQGLSGRGYNVAVVNQYSGRLESFAVFDLHGPTGAADTMRAEPLIQFLESITPGRKVAIGISDEGGINKTERVNRAMESVGSSMIRSVVYRTSWAISGTKGATIGSVPEAVGSPSVPVTVRDTLHAKSIEGRMLTPPIGPASGWNDFAMVVDTQLATHVDLNLIRIFTDGSRDTIRGVTISRDSVLRLLTRSVQWVQLEAVLRSDSAGLSPELSSWRLDFTPPAELVANYQTMRVVSDSVLEGEPLRLQIGVHNIGSIQADSVKVVVNSLVNNQLVPFSQVLIPMLPAGSSVTVGADYSTVGRSGRQTFVIQIDPDNRIVEQIKTNNVVSMSATVLRDTARPSIDVTFNGVRIISGDYVSTNPEIRVVLYDNSPLPITSPNSVTLRLNDRRIALGSSPDSLFESRSGPEKALVVYRPRLAKGEHRLSIQVQDATGNLADTAAQEIRFRVETESRLLNVVNIPNPFSRETDFTFNIVGSTLPEELLIKIYSVSGRLIHQITLPQSSLRFGFNQVRWNGRDAEGDELANGVYFYKLVMRLGEKNEEVIQKLAKVR
ncbi:MAG TPA: C25 family cysteine peptidase [Bacteroidota bacterium]|nr:C25 family cysteine peptidase [Bacteroidota bacterium]